MNKTIEGVGWAGFICPLDHKPKHFDTCLSCTHDVCDVPILRAMCANRYPVIENEYHVTELVGPPKIMKFRRENAYYTDPDAGVFMFIGSAVHEKIHRDNEWHYRSDTYRRHEIGFRHDLDPYTIVGTMDYRDHDRKLILDYKTCGAFKTRQLLDKAKNGSIVHDEYGLQLNGYRQWGFPEAETLRLHCIVV